MKNATLSLPTHLLIHSSMQYQITGSNLEITDKIRKVIDTNLIEPLDKLLRKFDDDVKLPKVKVSKKVPPGPPGYIINFDMWLPGKFHVYAEEDYKTLITCITKLREDVETQIKKYRGNKRPHVG